MSEIDDRIAALETRLNDLKVEDLPLEPLKRKLASAWLPDQTAELVSNTDVLQNLSFGRATLQFSANNDSADLAVEHGLGAEPRAMVATPYNHSPVLVKIGVVGRDNTTITFKGRGEAAMTANVEFSWVAIA